MSGEGIFPSPEHVCRVTILQKIKICFVELQPPTIPVQDPLAVLSLYNQLYI